MPTLWPFCPAPEFVEAVEWATDVIETFSAEQRIRATSSPRLTLSLSHRMSFRAWERAKLIYQGDSEWYVPLWQYRQRVSVAAGATEVSIDTTSSDYREGGFAVLWQSDESCEVIALDSFDYTTLFLGSGDEVQHTYSNGYVMPCRLGFCPDGLQADRDVNAIVPVSVEFLIYDSEDIADDSLYGAYRTYPIVTSAPRIGSGSFAEKILRKTDSVDNSIAKPFFDTVSDRMTRNLGLAWMLTTLADTWNLRTFIHSLYGKQKAFWVPDWTRGIELTSAIAPSDTAIRIKAIGLNDVAESGDLFLKTVSGSISTHRYTSISVSGDDEILTLSAAAGVTVSMGEERTLSLLRLCRLDQNRVEFNHRHLGSRGQLISVMVSCAEVPFA